MDVKKRILVIGDYCIDKFIYCRCERLSPEAPVPVAMPINEKKNEGMAGNVYRNIESLNLDLIGLDLIRSVEPIDKTRYIDEMSKQTLLRVDSNDYVSLALDVDDIKEDYDAIVIADYNKGFINEKFLKELPKKFKNTDLYLDTKKTIKEWGVDYIVKINELEYDKLMEEDEEIYSKHLIVTLGGKGLKFRDGKDSPFNFLKNKEEVLVRELSGAGDSFLAGLVTAYSIEDKNLRESLEFASKVATEAVKRVGVIAVQREWIR